MRTASSVPHGPNVCTRAHRKPVAGFSGMEEQNTFIGEQDFCFYYMFKTNAYGHNKIWGALPPNNPRGFGPGTLHVLVICLESNVKPKRGNLHLCTFLSFSSTSSMSYARLLTKTVRSSLWGGSSGVLSAVGKYTTVIGTRQLLYA